MKFFVRGMCVLLGAAVGIFVGGFLLGAVGGFVGIGIGGIAGAVCGALAGLTVAEGLIRYVDSIFPEKEGHVSRLSRDEAFENSASTSSSTHSKVRRMSSGAKRDEPSTRRSRFDVVASSVVNAPEKGLLSRWCGRLTGGGSQASAPTGYPPVTSGMDESTGNHRSQSQGSKRG